jgi:signal transduction histidine kinase
VIFRVPRVPSTGRPSGLTLLTGVLLVLLPTLAVLQYRWVGQVSAAERDRMQRNLRIAAAQFHDEFDLEIARAFLALQVGPFTAREGSSDRYSETYDTWVNTAAHPQIVANTYLIDTDQGRLRLRRWNQTTHEFTTASWPTILERWRPQLEQELASFNAGQLPDRRLAFRGEDSLLVAPLRSFVVNPDASTPQTVTPLFGFSVIELDLQFIREQLLPEIAERHFTHPDGDMYRVAVIATDEPHEVIYRSVPEATIETARADATEEFFGFRGGPGPPFRTRGGDRRAGTGDRRGGTADLRPGDQRRPDFRWTLLVQHQSGSLEAAVAGARRRNLAISFGILLLLTVSIVLLTASSRRAQRLAQQQIEFVAGISHELRTPIAVIRSAGENLSHGVIGNVDRVKRYGSTIEMQARRLGEMVERVLQYAGIESGRAVAARAPLNVEEIVESAIESAMPVAGSGIVIERNIAPALPPVVGDSAALRSAIQNLIANALKYGGTDRWVGIRATQDRDRRQSVVRITVSDHGSGIPPSELPHIFEPFYRGADAVNRQIEGNGLGLSLVQRIVNAHGGRVTVSSRPAAGSAFTITLPAAAPEARMSPVAGDLGAPAHAPTHQ